jgi:hypothetical protein
VTRLAYWCACKGGDGGCIVLCCTAMMYEGVRELLGVRNSSIDWFTPCVEKSRALRRACDGACCVVDSYLERRRRLVLLAARVRGQVFPSPKHGRRPQLEIPQCAHELLTDTTADVDSKFKPNPQSWPSSWFSVAPLRATLAGLLPSLPRLRSASALRRSCELHRRPAQPASLRATSLSANMAPAPTCSCPLRATRLSSSGT